MQGFAARPDGTEPKQPQKAFDISTLEVGRNSQRGGRRMLAVSIAKLACPQGEVS
jgi:hypothetical protein